MSIRKCIKHISTPTATVTAAATQTNNYFLCAGRLLKVVRFGKPQRVTHNQSHHIYIYMYI